MHKAWIVCCCGILFFISSSFAGEPEKAMGPISPPPMSFDNIDFQLYEILQKGINTHVIWAGNAQHKNIALTFDDGPNEKYTYRILKILQGNNVHATFFLIGQHAQRYPELVKQIYQAGHEIGNHTYSHIELTKIPSGEIKKEVEKTKDIVQELTGHNTVLFRPPWGVFDGRSLAELALRKYDAVLWSIDSRDWSRPGVEMIKKNVLSKVQNGSIILFHDDHDQIAQALPDIIKSLKDQGYQLVTIPELIELSLNGIKK